MLKAEKIESGYGQSKVLFGLDLEIPDKTVVSLIGRNGMGKTTTVRTIMGMLPLQAGTIRLGDEVVNGYRPHRIARLGCGLVPEGRHVFGSLSVYENLYATSRNDTQGPWTLDAVYELFPRLYERRSQSARTLSGGEQQMLAIGRALLTNPRLLILDEATEGLAPVIRQEIWACLNRLKREGQTILLIDKYVERLMALSDHHIILERGKLVWQGNSEALGADRTLWTRYLGV